MDDFLFTGADFSDFDYTRTRSGCGRKDAFLLVRLWCGYVHPDRDEREQYWIGRGCLSERDSRVRYNCCFNSDIELEWR